MRVRIAEWTETVIILLPGRIPQGKLNVLSANFDIGHIVFEHRWNINLASRYHIRKSKLEYCTRSPQKA